MHGGADGQKRPIAGDCLTLTEGIRNGDAFDYPKEVHFDVPLESNSYGGTGACSPLPGHDVGVNSVLVTGWQASWPK